MCCCLSLFTIMNCSLKQPATQAPNSASHLVGLESRTQQRRLSYKVPKRKEQRLWHSEWERRVWPSQMVSEEVVGNQSRAGPGTLPHRCRNTQVAHHGNGCPGLGSLGASMEAHSWLLWGRAGQQKTPLLGGQC